MQTEHPPYEGGWTDFKKNVDALSGHLESHVRHMEDKRARVEQSPNHPDLKRLDTDAIDRELVPLRHRASAASEGLFFHDPRDVSGGTSEHQTWVAMARKAGKLVGPDTYGPALDEEAAEHDKPIRVIRGGDGVKNPSAPSLSTR